MSPDQDFTSGEIQRSLARLEKSVADLTVEVRDRHDTLDETVTGLTGPVAILHEKMRTAESMIARMDLELEAITVRASWMAGAGAALAFVISLLFRFIK